MIPARFVCGEQSPRSHRETAIRTFLVSLLGATAVATGILILRSQKDSDARAPQVEIPPGETVPAEIVLDRVRRAGI